MKWNIEVAEGHNRFGVTKVADKYLLSFPDYSTVTLTEDQVQRMYRLLNLDVNVPKKKGAEEYETNCEKSRTSRNKKRNKAHA